LAKMGVLCQKIWRRIVIKIQQFPPPAIYDSEVRRKGLKFLRRNPNPSASEFSKHAYWKAIHDDLYQLYNGICSYCASWTTRNQGPTRDNTSVDHFIPKSVEPKMAYEWANYRLCRARLNSNKDDSMEVMDPFYIENGWFQIDFTTFLIVPSPELPYLVREHVNRTIDTLGLNDNDYVDERLEVVKLYTLDSITINNLELKYPFIAEEIRRSNFDDQLKPLMRSYFQRMFFGGGLF
jgi:hypothetical protein